MFSVYKPDNDTSYIKILTIVYYIHCDIMYYKALNTDLPYQTFRRWMKHRTSFLQQPINVVVFNTYCIHTNTINLFQFLKFCTDFQPYAVRQ